jgi:flagellar FliL protein
MKKILPLVLLLIGLGAGVGAGIFLRPEASLKTADLGDVPEGEQQEEHTEDDEEHNSEPKGDDGHGEADNEFVKLNNQFVVPIVADTKVNALVVLALSIEVPLGKSEFVYQREPKVRDSFLQVLFDHANIGGFDGNFTDAHVLGRLRVALKEVAQRDLGKKVAIDVLIVEIARQDY